MNLHVTITPTSLVATVLLTTPSRGVHWKEVRSLACACPSFISLAFRQVVSRTEWLKDQVLTRGCKTVCSLMFSQFVSLRSGRIAQMFSILEVGEIVERTLKGGLAKVSATAE